MAPKVNVWRANKKELIEMAHALKITVYEGWTIGEIRHLIQEHRKANNLMNTSEVPKGLGGMTLTELKNKAQELGIEVPTNATKGYLQLAIRDRNKGADEEVVTFGRYRNHLYREVPEGYLSWAIREVEANPNASMELRHLAAWAEDRFGSRNATSSVDPESVAVVPYSHSEPGASSTSHWSILAPKHEAQLPLKPKMKAKAMP
eukprot:s897_g5.t1